MQGNKRFTICAKNKTHANIYRLLGVLGASTLWTSTGRWASSCRGTWIW